MKILVIGASQGTGALAVREALARGHSVTAFARSPDRLKLESPNLVKQKGDFHSAASVQAAVPGHDAVIITASANKLSAFKDNPHYFSEGTRLVIEAMHAQRVRRLAVLSALGTGDSKQLLPLLVRLLIVSFLLKRPFQDHERQEALTRDSGLDWVIALPGRLTDGPARHQYERATRIESIPSTISRADVAHFLVDAVDQERWVRQSVLIGG